MDYKTMIQVACKAQGLDIKGWEQDEDYTEPRPQANLGRVRVALDDEENGLYEGTEGVLYASVVGGAEHNNERVAFHYMEDGTDSPNEVPDPMTLELI
jgi:hypothetical protein